MIDSIKNPDHEARSRKSLGISDEVIHESIGRVPEREDVSGGVHIDVWCGRGHLLSYVAHLIDRYVGTDKVRNESFPSDAGVQSTELETGRLGVDDGSMDTVVAVEVIEHLENSWAFVRELARVIGGVVVVTRPNQASALSLAPLAVERRHAAFQDVYYPAQLSAPLEVDLVADAAGVADPRIEYSGSDRIVFTPRYYPRAFALRFPRWLSDNLLRSARRRT